MRGIGHCVIGLLAFASGGCGAIASEEAPEDVGQHQEELFLAFSNWATHSTPNQLPVCWENRDYPDYVSIIETAVQQTWQTYTGVTFGGWSDCPATSQRLVRLGFVTRDVGNNYGGMYAGGAYGRSSALRAQGDLSIHFDVDTDVVPSANRVRFTAIHEFGHVLGFAHEQDRPDNEDHGYCDKSVSTRNGTQLTEFDTASVMNYCASNRTTLSALDKAGGQAVYTFPGGHTSDYGFCMGEGEWLFVARINADDRADLLCINPATGDMSAAYTDEDGHPGEESWRIPGRNFCVASGDRLYIGDVNGDGQDDLVCNNPGNGWLGVDRVDGNGQYAGTNWARTRNFCNGASDKLRIGYFNADARADLACVHSNGTVRVDLANNFGEFWSDDWSMAGRNYCRAAGERLYVGDANGDGRDDLICNNISNGALWIDYAAVDGSFTANDWGRTRNFCRAADEELLVLRLDADAQSDLLCRNRATGAVRALLATPAGQYDTVRWNGPFSYWCTGDQTYVSTGNFDGAGSSDDLMCESRVDGLLHLQYSILNL